MQTETCCTSEPEIQVQEAREDLLTEASLRKVVKEIVQEKSIEVATQTEDWEASPLVGKLVKLNLQPVDILRRSNQVKEK